MSGKNKTIAGRLRFLLLVLVPLAFFYIAVSIWGNQNVRQKSIQYMGALVDIYVKDIDEKIENINRKLGLLFLGEGEVEQDVNVYLKMIRNTENEAYRNYYISRLKNVFDTYALEYGDGYHFFAYFPETDWYVENRTMDLSVREYNEYETGIKKYFNEGQEGKNYGSQYWKIFTSEDGKTRILKYYKMRYNYIGCWIRPEDLILPLKDVMKEGDGAILLYDREGQLYAGLGDHLLVQNAGRNLMESYSEKQEVMEKDFTNMPFHIRFIISENGMFQTVLTVQMVMMILAFAMLALIFSCVVYLYQKILVPVRKFSNNLELIKNGEENLEEITSGELEELKRANFELTSLFQKINVLESEIQQRELEKQGMYMDYLKLQIRPHFYLNCLDFIYNMIDFENGDLARRMTHFTADYMRYLLKDNLSFVYLWEELEHVKNYMEIQKMRKEKLFDYCIDLEEEIEMVRIPHMLIQPFVENCMKYGGDTEYRVSVTITAYSEVIDEINYVNLCISDTGMGFPEEVLSVINGLEQPYNSGQRQKLGIGIVNTVQRLKHYYGSRCRIRFENGSVKGAFIDIHIPAVCTENEGGIL